MQALHYMPGGCKTQLKLMASAGSHQAGAAPVVGWAVERDRRLQWRRAGSGP